MITKTFPNLTISDDCPDFSVLREFSKRSPRDQDFRAKYKTEICRNWELGICDYGEGCAFAHGIEELRDKVNMGLKYKTKNCKQFHELGYCIYGNRCQFKHRDTADNTPNPSPKSEDNGRRRLKIFAEITGEEDL